MYMLQLTFLEYLKCHWTWTKMEKAVALAFCLSQKRLWDTKFSSLGCCEFFVSSCRPRLHCQPCWSFVFLLYYYHCWICYCFLCHCSTWFSCCCSLPLRFSHFSSQSNELEVISKPLLAKTFLKQLYYFCSTLDLKHRY